MKKSVKVLLIGVGVLFTLLVGLAIAVPLLFDPNDFRALVAGKVKEKTGRELQLGNVELKVFPWLRAKVDGVVLGNAEGFGPEPLARVGEAELGVKLLPLLFDRRAEVDAIHLKDVQLNLAVNAEGRSNWADLVKDEAKPEETKPEEDKGFGADDLDISSINLENVSAVYSDARSGQRLVVEQLRLKTGAIAPGKAFDLDFGTRLQAAQPAASAELALTGRVKHEPDAQRLGIENLKLALGAGGPQLAGGKEVRLDTELSGRLLMDLAARRLNLDELVFKLAAAGPQLVSEKPARLETEGRGQLTLDLAQRQLNLNGLQLALKTQAAGLDADLKLQTRLLADLANGLFQAPGLVLEGTIAGAAIPGGKQPLRLATDLQLNRKDGSLLLDKLNLQTAGLQLQSRIQGSGIGSETPKLSGPLQIAAFNPRPLLQQLGIVPNTADPKALTHLSLSANYQGSFTAARLENLALQLDQSQVRGSFGIRDFKTKALELGLKIDRIDADRYLPPKDAAAPAETKKPAQQQPAAGAESPLPFEAIQKLNANGSIDIGQLKLKGLTMTNVRLQLSGSPGATQEQALSAQLYGGRLSTTTRISPGQDPGVAAKVQLASLQAAPFLRDLVGKDRVSGLGNLTLDLTGRGDTVSELKRSLNGNIAFRVENGAVKGFNLAQVLRRARAALEGNLNYQENAPEETDFTVFSASARIVNGVLHSDQLEGASPLFRVDGAGQIDLVNNTINYLAKPTVVKTSKGQGGKALEDLAGITIPVKLTGNLYQPKVSLDLRAALQQKATEQLRERLSDKEDELRGKLQEKLGKELGVQSPEGKPLDREALKQQLNNRLGDFLSGRKQKREEAPPAEAPAAPAEGAPAPAPEQSPAPAPASAP